MPKTHRVKRVLKYEQQQLDDLVQELAERNAAMQQIHKRMKDLKDRQEQAIRNVTDRTSIVAATNRTAWCKRLHQQWKLEQTASLNMEQEIDRVVENVRAQHSRVRAIETLLDKAASERNAEIHNRRSIELSDLVLNSYLERQP